MGLISNLITGGISGGFSGMAEGAADSIGQKKRSKFGAAINPDRPDTDPTDLGALIFRRRTQKTPTTNSLSSKPTSDYPEE